MGAWYPPIVAVQAAGVCWGQVTLDDQVDQGSRSAGSVPSAWVNGTSSLRTSWTTARAWRMAAMAAGASDGLTMPGGRDDLRNSQVTSIKHDRH
jgi:hypothetical protein